VIDVHIEVNKSIPVAGGMAGGSADAAAVIVGINELYDLEKDPYELTNSYTDPTYSSVRKELLGNLYESLRDRGDKFFHWMTSMYEVGDLNYDPSMGQLDKTLGKTTK
jgi:hypothetical protein